jgi:hypothetical protein
MKRTKRNCKSHTLGWRDTFGDADKLYEDFTAIKEWLISQDVDPLKGRFADYVRFIASWKSSGTGKMFTAEMATYFREIHELLWAYRTFRVDQSDLTAELIKKTLQSNALPGEKPEGEKGRNYLLQLRAAAYFLKSGFEVRVDSDADVVAYKDEATYYVECKRIYSLKQVSKRMREIRDQLHRRLLQHPSSAAAYGIAWLDPTPVLIGKIGLYSAFSNVGAQVAVRMDLHVFADLCSFDLLKTDKRILAAVIQAVWPCASVIPDRLVIGFTSLIVPLVSDAEFEQRVRPLFDMLMTQYNAPVFSQFDNE